MAKLRTMNLWWWQGSFFCFFRSMEQPFSAYNVRNIRVAGLGLVPNESPKAKDHGPCYTPFFATFFKIDFKMCHIWVVGSLCFAHISRTNWARELGLVPNESSFSKVSRPHIFFSKLYNHCHSISFFATRWSFLPFLGLQFTLFH